MAGPTIAISVLADTKVAEANLGQLRSAVASTEANFDALARSSGEFAEKIDTLGGASAKVAGALGDVGGSLNEMGLISDASAEKLDSASKIIMGLAGVADLAVTASAAYTAAKNAEVLANGRAAVSAVASRTAMIAGTVATGAMTVAQGALNAVMALNPIGLVVIAIVALVAIFVIAYKKSETFRDIVNGAFTAVKNGIQAALDFIVSAFGVWLNAVKAYIGFFTGLPDKFRQFGKAIVDGFANAIENGKDALKKALQKLVGFLPGFIKKKLGIASPSKVTYKLGRFVSQGFANGIAAGTPEVSRAAAALQKVATASLSVGGILAGTSADGATARASRTTNVTINAPTGADAAAIGRELKQFIGAADRAYG